MNRFKCFLMGVFYTLRYPHILFRGEVLKGHELQYNGEIYRDMWEMRCRRCGIFALSELNPNAEMEEL